MNNKITTLIIDDESLSRDNITDALSAHNNWSIIEQLEDATQLIDKVLMLAPDVIFLDIHMPGVNGIDVSKQIFKLPNPPLIVFVTAFDDYAIEAFELMAIDYLLKPFNDQRFDQAIKKAEYLLNDQYSINKVRNWHLDQMNQRLYLDQFVIRSIGSIKFVAVANIYWIKASGNYTEIHHSEGIDLYRITIKGIETKIDPESFIRIHRSAIVKLSMIKEIKITDHNRLKIILCNGDFVNVSAAYKNALLKRLDL
jgi:two-component system LytT family response regulator